MAPRIPETAIFRTAPSGCRTGKRVGPPSFWTISDNGLLCQLHVGFRAELDIGSSRGEVFLRQLAVGGVKSNLFLRGTSIRRGMSFFPQTQVLKDLSNDVPLVNEANDCY